MRKIILLLFVLSMQLTFAQDGHIDLSFNPGDRGNGYGDGGGASTMLLLPDGKVLLSGNNLFNGRYVQRYFRVNPDGDVDNTFNAGGSGPMFGYVSQAILLPDGKII